MYMPWRHKIADVGNVESLGCQTNSAWLSIEISLADSLAPGLSLSYYHFSWLAAEVMVKAQPLLPIHYSLQLFYLLSYSIVHHAAQI